MSKQQTANVNSQKIHNNSPFLKEIRIYSWYYKKQKGR